jgi:hypothetical protein
MNELSWREIRELVYLRANRCCEYCQTCEDNTGQTMQIDHIDPDGGDVLENLCLSCWNCNNYKRSAKGAFDTLTGEMISLYHPRRHEWADHFQWIEGATKIIGLTPIGRVTIERLKMNRPMIVVARQRWVIAGFHPPKK